VVVLYSFGPRPQGGGARGDGAGGAGGAPAAGGGPPAPVTPPPNQPICTTLFGNLYADDMVLSVAHASK
jgi:hypothetical protein